MGPLAASERMPVSCQYVNSTGRQAGRQHGAVLWLKFGFLTCSALRLWRPGNLHCRSARLWWCASLIGGEWMVQPDNLVCFVDHKSACIFVPAAAQFCVCPLLASCSRYFCACGLERGGGGPLSRQPLLHILQGWRQPFSLMTLCFPHILYPPCPLPPPRSPPTLAPTSPPSRSDVFQSAYARLPRKVPLKFAAPGAERQDSVFNGFQQIDSAVQVGPRTGVGGWWAGRWAG